MRNFNVARIAVGAALVVSVLPAIARADESPDEAGSHLQWFQTTRYRGGDVWELGALGGVGIPSFKDRGGYDATMKPGPAFAIESAWRKDLNPWLELAMGTRFAYARSVGDDSPRTLEVLTMSAPVQVVFGKAWPRESGGFWRSPTRASIGVAPMVALDQVTLARGGKTEGRLLAGCVLIGMVQRTPSSRAIDDVFIEGDVCTTTPERVGDASLRLDQAFVWVGYHAGWPVRLSKQSRADRRRNHHARSPLSGLTAAQKPDT